MRRRVSGCAVDERRLAVGWVWDSGMGWQTRSAGHGLVAGGRIDRGDLQPRLCNVAGKVAGGPRREFNQAYSPDGTTIAFDAHEDGISWESGTQWDVCVMSADGSGRRNLTGGNNVNDWGPSWSPDGKTIVFLSGLENVYDLHLMNADGTNVRRLTHWTAAPAKKAGS